MKTYDAKLKGLSNGSQLQFYYTTESLDSVFFIFGGKSMEYITVKEAANKWGLTERRIQVLCREGRIEGAKKFGRDWAIPVDSQKPGDARVSSGKYKNWRKKSHSDEGKLNS